MAHSTRPQLASAPNMAAFTRLEQTTDLATVLACASSAAPVTVHSSSLVAPSPSAAMQRHRWTVTVLSAAMKASNSGPSAVISAFPAWPLARMTTMSLVEVSPSTLTILKVRCTSLESAFCSMAGLTAASVVRNTSIVAMLGWIIPEPLAMPPSTHCLPPTVNSTASCLGTVSVVMMPSTAASAWSPRPAASAGMPPAMGVISSGWPMTPVDATTTSSAAMPS